MDRKIIKQFRKMFILESLFSGAASFTKVLDETEDELEDMIKYIDKKANAQKLFEGKIFKKGKY